ncbi:PAS domain S-box protein [candidate division KSB1 bacterium]
MNAQDFEKLKSTLEKLEEEIAGFKLTKDVLAEESLILNKIIKLNPCSISLYDAGGHYVIGNQAYKVLFGSVPPKEYSIFKDPVLIELGFGDLINELKNGSEVRVPEIWYNPRHVRSDLPDRPVLVRGTAFPILDESKNIRAVVVMHEDITKKAKDKKESGILEENYRAQLEKVVSHRTEELKRTESELTALLDNIPDIAWFKDLDSNFILVNKALAESCGFSPAELKGKTDFDICPKPLAERYRLDDKEVIKSGKTKRTEEPFKDKDDVETVIETIKSPIYDENGKIVGTVGIARDITERKKVENALRESEERFRELSDLLPLPCFELNKDMKIGYANKASVKMSGYTLKEMLRMDPLKLFEPEEHSKLTKDFGKVFSGEKVGAREYTAINKSGRKFKLEILSNRIIRDGATVGIRGVGEDITDRKKAEEELLKHRQDLEDIVDKRTSELKKINERLQHDIFMRKKAEDTTSALYKMIRAVNAAESLKELYPNIHKTLGNILDTTNFFIGLYDKEKDILRFPYFTDEHDSDAVVRNASESGSLTAEVIKKRVPLFIKKDELLRRFEEQNLVQWGTVAEVWLGVPLKIKNDIIGVIAVQSYSDPDLYSENDIELLESVSEQIAIAIDMRRNALALKESQEHVKNLSEQISRLSLSVADMITTKNPEEVFDRISNAIVDFSDFRRVLISYFKDEPPYRDIIGWSGLEENAVNKLRKINMHKDGYLEIFENGINVGQFSYYVPHTMKDLVDDEATIFGSGPEPDSEDLWHPEDNLFVRMNDKEGNLIGVISVDECKSGRKPTAETVRPLEVFSSIISQIILHKKAEQMVKELEEQYIRAQKMESMGKLAGAVAHDLNHILTGLVTYPDLMLLDMQKDDPFREKIVNIKKSGQRAAAVVEDLLNIARGGMTVSEIMSLNELIKDYLNSPEIKQIKRNNPGFNVRTRLESGLRNISCSKIQIIKILNNLIINAADATPEGGALLISTENRFINKTIKQFEEIPPGEYVLLTISDKGIGIPRNDIPKIFEPYYTKKVLGRSGSGIGLTVVWNIVKDHEGYINVESELGEGTDFHIYLPVSEGEIEIKKKKKDFEEYMGDGESILIIDDEESLRRNGINILKIFNYSPTACSSGEEAIDYLKNNKADLILLDMLLGKGMDGLETFKEIVKMYPGQKVIIVSGYSASSKIQEVQRLGAGQFVKKPFTIEELGNAVKKELYN